MTRTNKLASLKQPEMTSTEMTDLTEVLPGTDQIASLKKQSSQVNVLIKLICPIVEGTATGNEDHQDHDHSRRQEIEQELTTGRLVGKATEMKERRAPEEDSHIRRLEIPPRRI